MIHEELNDTDLATVVQLSKLQPCSWTACYGSVKNIAAVSFTLLECYHSIIAPEEKLCMH